MDVVDKANLSGNSKLRRALHKDEVIIYSTTVDKINRNNKKQKRILLLTDRAIYNVDGSSIKRRIDLEHLSGITISFNGAEFVLHVPTEYDYRY
jgi:hypothetical protein